MTPGLRPSLPRSRIDWEIHHLVRKEPSLFVPAPDAYRENLNVKLELRS
jgi:hypothetical protein